jgi:hypothetical protein
MGSEVVAMASVASISVATAWPARFVRTISCRSPMLRASRSMRVTIGTSPFRRKSRTVRNSARFAVLVPDLFSDRGATLPLQGVPRISAFLRSNCKATAHRHPIVEGPPQVTEAKCAASRIRRSLIVAGSRRYPKPSSHPPVRRPASPRRPPLWSLRGELFEQPRQIVQPANDLAHALVFGHFDFPLFPSPRDAASTSAQ